MALLSARIEIHGHTDAERSDAHNRSLPGSARYARASC
jgi:outer membrane protein OmpA-like peptidoglycan-associated protein